MAFIAVFDKAHYNVRLRLDEQLLKKEIERMQKGFIPIKINENNYRGIARTFWGRTKPGHVLFEKSYDFKIQIQIS